MRVSVILPCYEAGPWIGEGLASVRAQTAPPHEVIVINDASTDDSIGRVQASGVPVRLLNVNVHNAARARNAGIEAATGDWIAFLDADDAWYPDHLKNAAILLESSGDVAYMANHHFVFGQGSVARLPESLRPKIDETRSGLSHLCFVSLLTQGFHFGHSTVLLRLDRVREVGSFDVTQKRRHDVDLWLRVIRDRTWAWGAIPAARYRIDTPESISKSVVNCQVLFPSGPSQEPRRLPWPCHASTHRDGSSAVDEPGLSRWGWNRLPVCPRVGLASPEARISSLLPGRIGMSPTPSLGHSIEAPTAVAKGN